MFYGEDLARIHEQGFGDFASAASVGLLRLFHRHGLYQGHVVDLGCGSGIWASRLVDSGFTVTGVDLSGPMIAIARCRAPKAQFIQVPLHDFEFPGCIAVTALGECVNYVTEEGPAVPSFAKFFQKVHRCLVPGGLLIFDVLEEESCRKLHRVGEDWAVLVDVEVDTEAREAIRKITTFRRTQSGYRRTDEVHRMKLFEVPDLVTETGRAGFDVTRLPGYGEQAFREGQAGLLCKKTGGPDA